MIGTLARRPSWMVGAAALCVCVPSGLETESGAQEISAADLAGAVLVAGAAVLIVARRAAPPPRVLLAFAPVAAAAGLATLCSTDAGASLPGFVRVVQIFVLVPLAVVTLVRDRTDGCIVAGAVVAAGVGQSCYGIWQALTGNGASISGETVRAVGTFGASDVMALSVIAGYGIVITLSFLLAGPRRLRPFAVAALAVLGTALTLALSRGSWIAIGAAAGLVLLAYSVRLVLRTAVTVAALGVIAIGGLGAGAGSETLAARTQSMTSIADTPDQSVLDRYSLWAAAAGMWGDHPVTGVGVKNFPAYRDTYAPIELSAAGEVEDPSMGYRRQPLLSPHNQYLLFLSEQGVVGLAAMLGLFATLLYGLWTRRDARDPLWLLSAGFLAGLLINFLYADMSGASSALAAIMIGLAARTGLGGRTGRTGRTRSGRTERTERNGRNGGTGLGGLAVRGEDR